MTEKKQEHDRILERNVSELLTRANEPPRLADDARGRILEALTVRVREQAAAARPARSERERPRLGRRPLLAGGLALAACAAAALVVVPMLGGTSHTVHHNLDPAPQRVALADGSQLILDHGAEVEVLGKRHLRLRRGEVLFDVAPADGERFRIDTAQGHITVLGTRFTAAAADGETRAAVARGKVELSSSDGSAVLGAGEEGILRKGAAPERRRAPRLSHLASFAAGAEAAEEIPDAGPVRKGALLARNPTWQEQEFPLPLRKLDVDVFIENQVARVALDQTFFNPRDQQLEGVYRLTLPPGAAISRQAMYVDGVLRESAIVERQQARRIYEEIVYTRRDPALMEWMAGNLYQVRIFPLPPRSEKRIVFEYTQNLARLYDDVRVEVPLPEADGPIGALRLHTRLVGCAECTVTSTSHAITTSIDGKDAVVDFTRDSAKGGGSLLLTIRQPQSGPRVAAHRAGDQQFWMARVQPHLGDGGAAPGKRRWIILHDTSASRAPLELKAQSYLIDRLLQEMDEEDEVNLVAFDTTVRAFAPDFVRVDAVDRRRVAQFLGRESRDAIGATDLAAALDKALALLGHAPADAAPHILYLGDGIATGAANGIETLRRKLTGKATFVGVAVGARMDLVKLGALAAHTGGYATAMNPGEDLRWRAFDLVAALNTPRVVDLTAEALDAEGRPVTGDLYVTAGQLADGEELGLIARLTGSTPASVRLAGTVGGAPWTQTIALPRPPAESAGYLPRLWAQRRVEALLTGDIEGGRHEIIELGTEHFLMTPYTSLLVLESDEMVRQYGVKQGRSNGWAAYRLPARIPVVYQPAGTSPVVGNAPIDAVLVRTPTKVFNSYNGYGYWDDADGDVAGALIADGLRNDNQGPTFASHLAGFDPAEGEEDESRRGAGGGGSGTGQGYGRAHEEGAETKVAADKSNIDLVTETTAVPTMPASQPVAAAEPDAPATVVVMSTPVGSTVTTGELAQNADDWTMMEKNKKGGKGYGTLDGRFRDGHGWAEGGVRRGPRANAARTRGYGGYRGGGELYPAAYQWSGDPRLDDLTEMVPAIYTDAHDVERDELLRALAGRRGSITAEARALVDAGHAWLPARLRASDDETIDLAADGSFRIDRVLDTGLVEQVLFDGRHLEHRYPELGLAVRREGDAAGALLWARLAPYALPSADMLARVYDVTLAAPRTLRLALPGGRGRAIDLLVDDTGRVIEVRAIGKKATTTLLRVDHDASGLVIINGDERTRLRRELSAGTGASAAADLTVIEMPLRQPAYWFEKARATTAGSAAWRQVQVQLLASWAAFGNAGALTEVALAMRAQAVLRRGEIALGSRGLATTDVARAQMALAGADPDDPLIAYLQASRRHRLPGKGADTAFDAVAARAKGSLIGLLATYRGAIAARDPDAPTRREAARRLRVLAAGYHQPALLYIAAHQFAGQHGWRAPMETVAAWDLVADSVTDPRWQRRADLAATRVLYQNGRYDQAGERALRLLTAADAPAAIDPLLPQVIRQSVQGEVGWRLAWNRLRAEALRKGDLDALLGLLTTARMVGEYRDITVVAARIAALPVSDADQLADMVDALEQAGRADEAAGLVDGHARLIEGDAPLMLRASLIAERRGRLDDAVTWLDKAMTAYAGEPVTLAELRTDYARLIALHGRRAQASGGDVRRVATDAALAAAAAWRKLDPDNSAIDTAAAELLHALGRPEEAGRYLSTTIERHPLEGDAYRVVAEAYEREGDVERALPLWERAAEVEPTNPTWLLRRSQALAVVGQRGEAETLLDRIAAGTWHSRFAGVVDQARRLRR